MSELSPSPLRAVGDVPERELLVRRATREGRDVAVLRAVGRDGVWRVEAVAGGAAVGPFACADEAEALALVAEAVEALVVLGCDVTNGPLTPPPRA